MRVYMDNIIFSFDETKRERFEYPNRSFPFITWIGSFKTFADRCLVCHWHGEFEYDVVLSGCVDYYIDGKHIRASQGDVVFINSNAMHTATQVGNECASIYTVSFLPSLFTSGNNTPFYKKYFQSILQSNIKGFFVDNKTSTGKRITELLQKIYAFELEEPEYYELLCISFMSDIWQNTLAYIKEEEQQLSSLDTNDETQKRVKDILFYIHEHYAEDIRIDDLAHYAHICRSECFRCFKRYFNKSPMSYLTEYRLSYAVKALKDTEKSVTEIAIECGFSTASYFGKQFKKAYAITPLQFRQSLQAQDKN